MTRLVDADELHEIVNWSHEKPPYSKKKIHRLIDMTRTVDAEQVKHGKWMPREEGVVYPFWERYTCSACGKHADNTEYCPHCGARMVDKDD